MHKKAPSLLIVAFVLSLFLSSRATAIPWKKMSITPSLPFAGMNLTLQHINGSSKNNVFAVGFDENNNTGVILHYNNSSENSWSIVQLPEASKKLYAVWAASGNRVFVVGEGGTILSGYQDRWISMDTQGIKTTFQGVWGSSAHDVFAIADAGVIVHYNGNESNTWQKMDSGFTGNLNGIWGTSPKNVFAVGDSGTILHYNGRIWEKKLQDDQYGILKGVWGSSGKNIFVVGARGIILHSTDAGRTWVSEKNADDALNNLNSIGGRAKNNIYAVGDNGIVLYYDGKNWSVQEPNLTTTPLYGVWACPNPHAYVVGANGFIGGKSWSAIRGWIYDSCTGNGFQGAQVQRFNETTQQWQTWCNGITTTGGWYDCTSEQCALAPGTYQFRFTADNYSAQTKDINVIANTWIESYTYLLPISGYERCISGVISEITTLGGGTFSRAMPSVPVALYRKSCTSWDPTSYAMNASSGGHYHFKIGAGQDGTYKVVPSNYNFYPEYDNIEIVIPQDQSTINSYDFTKE